MWEKAPKYSALLEYPTTLEYTAPLEYAAKLEYPAPFGYPAMLKYPAKLEYPVLFGYSATLALSNIIEGGSQVKEAKDTIVDRCLDKTIDLLAWTLVTTIYISFVVYLVSTGPFERNIKS